VGSISQFCDLPSELRPKPKPPPCCGAGSAVQRIVGFVQASEDATKSNARNGAHAAAQFNAVAVRARVAGLYQLFALRETGLDIKWNSGIKWRLRLTSVGCGLKTR
jgi:hypothetical protein